jgi:hypothetical protein
VPEQGNEVGRELKVLEKSWCAFFAEFQTRSDSREEVQTPSRAACTRERSANRVLGMVGLSLVAPLADTQPDAGNEVIASKPVTFEETEKTPHRLLHRLDGTSANPVGRSRTIFLPSSYRRDAYEGLEGRRRSTDLSGGTHVSLLADG